MEEWKKLKRVLKSGLFFHVPGSLVEVPDGVHYVLIDEENRVAVARVADEYIFCLECWKGDRIYCAPCTREAINILREKIGEHKVLRLF